MGVSLSFFFNQDLLDTKTSGEIMFEIMNLGKDRFNFKMISLANSPVAASHSSVCVISDRIFVAGGLGTSITSINNLSHYNITTDRWVTLPSMPVNARSGSISARGDKLIYVAGYNQGPNTVYSAVRPYQISTTAWETGTPTLSLSTNRYDLTYTTLSNGKHYIFGGIDSGGIVTANQYIDLSQSILTITPIANYPGGIRRAGCVYDGSRYIYIAGGVTSAGVETANFRRYDTIDNQWLDLTPMPITSQSVSLMKIQQNIYAYVASSAGQYFNKIYMFDVNNNYWKFIQEVVGNIHGLVPGVVYNNSMYLVGGYNGTIRHNFVSKLVYF